MAEFTGNIHNLELALPFPPGGTPLSGLPYAVGRTFGDAAGNDLLDVWIHDHTLVPYDQPDGPPVSIEISSLIAVTHGWLRFVDAGQPVPSVVHRDGTPLVVDAATLVLQVWSTLRGSLDRMAEQGSMTIPQTEAGRGGRPALEYLIYENVDPGSLNVAIEALIAEARPDPYFTAADRSQMVQDFRAGQIRVLARAGRVIGRAGAGDPPPPPPLPEASVGYRRVTFRAVDRLGQLFDPGYFFRRVQELAHVPEFPAVIDKTLIPSREAVRDHEMPGQTPRRRILDWRDETGRPMAGASFAFAPLTGGQTDFVTTNAAGLWVGPPAATGGDPQEATLVAQAPGVRLGVLPDAPRSSPSLVRDVLPDDYLVVSAIDLEAWFPARGPSTSMSVEPLRRFTEGNRVTALIDARRTYSLVYRALRRTFRDDDFENVPEGGRPAAEGPPLPGVSGHRIYLADWRFGPELWLPAFDAEAFPRPKYDADAQMVDGTTFNSRGHLMGILNEAIAAGVDVRALLWRQQEEQPDHSTNNTAAVKFLNREAQGRRGQAILDSVGRSVGSHHQKAFVIQNADGRMAFVGGVDLAMGRWDTPEHKPDDDDAAGGRDKTNAGWHDTHTLIEGPAVDDVETNFRQRWNAHPDVATDGRTPVPSRPPAEQIDPIPDASHFVQINRTMPPGVTHFPFVDAIAGEPAARLARVNAIQRARRFVYIEDQYLTMVDAADYDALMQSSNPLAFIPAAGDTVAAALRQRLVGPDRLDFVAILVPRRLSEDPRFANGVIYEMRKRFITFLTRGLSDAEARDRLLVFHLRNSSGQFTYVHAKNMVVDDVYASIGSSNMGYRSLTYDTEINCDVIDGAIVRGARKYARDFRVELWREHLRLGPGGGPLVVDPRRGFEMLRDAAEGKLARSHAIERYDPAFIGDDLAQPGAPPLYDPTDPDHEIVRTHLIDPDARQPDSPLDWFALVGLIN